MRSTLAVLFIGLMLAAGSSVMACSSSDTVPDDNASETPQYDSAQEPEYQEYETAEQPPAGQPQQQPGQPQQGAAEFPEATGPVATVDGVEIPAEEFNDQLDMVREQSAHLPPEFLGQMQDEIIEQLVQTQLLHNAIDEAGIEITDDQVDVRLDELREEFRETAQAQFDEDLEFDDFIAQMGMSPEELREVVRETVAIETLLEQRGADMPTDEDVRAFYDENPEAFTEPEMIEARHLLVGVMAADEESWNEARQTANELHQKATEEDTDFDELAEEYPGDVTVQQIPIAVGQPHQPQEVEDAAFALEDGEISEPIRTAQGWLLIERIEHVEERVVPFEEVEAQLERELRNQAMEESLDDFLAQLRDDAEIEIHPENIQ